MTILPRGFTPIPVPPGEGASVGQEQVFAPAADLRNAILWGIPEVKVAPAPAVPPETKPKLSVDYPACARKLAEGQNLGNRLQAAARTEGQPAALAALVRAADGLAFLETMALLKGVGEVAPELSRLGFKTMAMARLRPLARDLDKVF
jgi:hypothetical protein